jgi:hypothetical protein
MRISAANGTALAAKSSAARRAGPGGFALGASETPANPAPAAGLRAISSLDALLALQGVEDVRERRKRAVAKGRNALDVLDKLKLGLIDGSLDTSTLNRLKVASEGLTESSGDPGLDSVLAEIDLRVAVELAKAGIG